MCAKGTTASTIYCMMPDNDRENQDCSREVKALTSVICITKGPKSYQAPQSLRYTTEEKTRINTRKTNEEEKRDVKELTR